MYNFVISVWIEDICLFIYSLIERVCRYIIYTHELLGKITSKSSVTIQT